MSTLTTGAESVEWNLDDLYDGPDDPRIESELEESHAAAKAFRERYRGTLGELTAAELNAAVEELERIESTSTRVETYARLRQAADSTDQARGALVQRVRERNTQIETELLFFDLEWGARRRRRRRAAARRPRHRALRPGAPVAAPLQAAPALRAGGEDLGREEPHGGQRLGPALQRARLRPERLARRQRPLARRGAGEAVPGDLAGGARPCRRGDHGDAAARRAHARLRPQHDPERAGDRGPPARLRLVDLGPQPRERDPGRGRAEPRRRDPVAATTSRSVSTR